jgi:RHS repeat-associated protein
LTVDRSDSSKTFVVVGFKNCKGKADASADGNHYKFTGKERDTESGLDNFGARFDSSGFGRIMSPDDFTKDSDVRDPQSWNKYAYARNNPLRYTDPTGEEATVTTSCDIDQGQQTCKVVIRASIAIYSVNGTTLDQLQKAQSAIASQVDQAWSGSFTQDGTTYNVSTNGYGVGYNYDTGDHAIQRAHEEMDSKGIVYDDPHKYSSTEFKGCGVAQGAVAGVRNPAKPDVLIALTIKFGAGGSESDAEEKATQKCQAHPNAQGKNCEVLESW